MANQQVSFPPFDVPVFCSWIGVTVAGEKYKGPTDALGFSFLKR